MTKNICCCYLLLLPRNKARGEKIEEIIICKRHLVQGKVLRTRFVCPFNRTAPKKILNDTRANYFAFLFLSFVFPPFFLMSRNDFCWCFCAVLQTWQLYIILFFARQFSIRIEIASKVLKKTNQRIFEFLNFLSLFFIYAAHWNILFFVFANRIP